MTMTLTVFLGLLNIDFQLITIIVLLDDDNSNGQYSLTSVV